MKTQDELKRLAGCGDVPSAVNRVMRQAAVELDEAHEATALRSLDAWNEEDGDVLWWAFPVVEPPYCGSPLADDFPDYVTHWTRILVPDHSSQCRQSGSD
jgi:hypothetical protein